ncbi:MAG: ABC transporter permease [Fimbriimonas sp.]|nr:ABC transporter permease [Fimbriimonas sp.]
MNFVDSVQTALRAISANKLRSFLTMLGVVIGVGSVIAMIGIGEGTKKKSLEQIEVMGTNMLMVMPNWRRGGMGLSSDIPTLKDEDVPQLRKDVPLIAFVSGTVSSRAVTKYKSTSYMTQVTGGEPQIAIIRNATKMYAGHWYTMDDEAKANNVCVLGWVAYQELFNDENAIGTQIRIKNESFTVLGVCAYKGGTGNWNPDDQIYVPLATAKHRLLGRRDLDMIAIQGRSSELLPITQQQVEDSLGRKRKNASGEPLFRVMNQGDWIETMQKQTQLLSILLAGIASISLLVGGIGIMNIMLVSVTERTREIGLRKALGAKREGILGQFLLESIVMCSVGGLIGITLGTIAVFGISGLLKVPPMVNTQAVIIAFGFSAGVGLFFGLYPALRASRLEPIEALRYE